MIQFFLSIPPRWSLTALTALETPSFLPLVHDRDGYASVCIQPAAALAAIDDVVEQLKCNDRVDLHRDCLAIVEFQADDHSSVENLGIEAADLWCRKACRDGWRIWLLGRADADPSIEIGLGEGLGRLSCHELPLRLLVVGPEHMATEQSESFDFTPREEAA